MIERTLKSLTPAKPVAPSAKPTATTPPPFVSSEMLSLRVRVEPRCETCRATLAGLMMMTEVEISRILAGLDQPADGFLGKLAPGWISSAPIVRVRRRSERALAGPSRP